MSVQNIQIEIGSHLGFSACAVNPRPLRLPDARQPCWSYSDSHFAKVTTSGCMKKLKAEYGVSQHKVNWISKYVY